MMSFTEWLKVREDFHQGTGGMGASIPLKPKQKRGGVTLTTPPDNKVEKGQAVQGTRRDDGNG
jgi:hypothetical protein